MDWVSFQKHMACKLKKNPFRLQVLSNLQQADIVLRYNRGHSWIKQNTMIIKFNLYYSEENTMRNSNNY